MLVINKNNYFFYSLCVTIAFAFIKIILSNIIGLSNDESYYWTYAQQLQWNYFDHPPMIAIWLKLFTLNLYFQDFTFFLRLGSIVSAAIASVLMFKTVANICNEKAGFFAVLLFNFSFYASITAGLLVMPDAPQMLFWVASLYFVTLINKNDALPYYWLGFGICAGLCIMSKVHGIFLWSGLILFALLYSKKWFTNKWFYIAGLFTIIIISPIFIWNFKYDFITYKFHSQRVIIKENALIHWYGLLKEIIGQLILNNVFVVLAIVFFMFYKKRFIVKTNMVLSVFICIALPLLLIIFWLAIFKQTLPHWSGPVFITLIPVAAVGLTYISAKAIKLYFVTASIYCIIFFAAISLIIQKYPGTFGNTSTAILGKGDISLDSYGWEEAGRKFQNFYYQSTAHSTYKPALVCNTWWGAHEEYFFARPLQIPMIGLGPVNEIHQYQWTNREKLNITNIDTTFCIVHSDEYYNPQIVYANYYKHIDSLLSIPILRNSLPAHNFYVYKLYGLKNDSQIFNNEIGY